MHGFAVCGAHENRLAVMGRRTAILGASDFQLWLESAIERRGVTLAELARMVDTDYSHLWKILRGDPAKYPTSRRPGYELTRAIGVALGDVDGAVFAAGFVPDAPPTSSPSTGSEGRLREVKPGYVAGEVGDGVEGGELERIPELPEVIHHYSGVSDEGRELVKAMLEKLYDQERRRREGE